MSVHYYDKSLGCEITSESERKKIMKKKGLEASTSEEEFDSVMKKIDYNEKRRKIDHEIKRQRQLKRAIYDGCTINL
jgi:hypothetical protein